MLVVARSRRRGERIRELLDGERFAVEAVPIEQLVARLAVAPLPTVALVDCEGADGSELTDLAYALRRAPGSRGQGPRLVVIADGAAAAVLAGSTGIAAVVCGRLDAEELVDAVWQAHHAGDETI